MALNSAKNMTGAILRSRAPLATASARSITSKALRIKKPKPAPFPYETEKFYAYKMVTDRTTPRLDENSKLICVEGAHGIGKTKLAQELAEEFEMLYMPPLTMENVYTSPYGLDYRAWNEYYPDWWKCFDDKDFLTNPLGGAHPSTLDRYFFNYYRLKWITQFKAIRHILNTGQGVVVEGGPHSHQIYMKAAAEQGWLQPETLNLYAKLLDNTLHEVFRPNLIVYLDGSVDTVQKRKKSNGNEVDKNSPVWNNSAYLNSIYSQYLNTYLRDMQDFSRVLVYDWTDGGDTEVVVEDIENMEFDLIEKFSDQQKDWRLIDEHNASLVRYSFTGYGPIHSKMRTFLITEAIYSDIIACPPEDYHQMRQTLRFNISENFMPFTNPLVGDKIDFWRTRILGMPTQKSWEWVNSLESNLFFPHHELAYAEELSAGVRLDTEMKGKAA